ncbi:MAG: glycoside hydrolase family 3 protein, partial [Treponema sp.]|nr:glycoside hydrolase family 3 protein [Treponema sp.]
ESAVLPDPLLIRAGEIASLLDDRLLAAQALITGIDGSGKLPSHIRRLLEEIPVGGIMLFTYNLDTDNNAIRSFISEAVSLIETGAGIAPFVAVDQEGGTVNRFRNNTAQLPSASSLPDASFYWELAKKEGIIQTYDKIETDSFNAASEIADLGINMNFAPIAEYLIDENRRFLRYRSYGPDPYFAADAAFAFIRGMERANIICVVKHFPGSAGSDPHYSASVLDLTKEELDKLVYPFKSLINRGARAVMAAHTLTPVIDSEIASLSKTVMENWLRRELGFNGIIIADDFIMASAQSKNITGTSQAAVHAINAGIDMLLVWPHELKQVHNTILTALTDETLPRARLEQAVTRVIYEKLRNSILTTEYTEFHGVYF